MLVTKLPATPAAPAPWGSSSSRRALLEAALGSCLHTSHLPPLLQDGCRGSPWTPSEMHIRISLSWSACGHPGWWAYHQVNVPGKGQHWHAAAQPGCAPYCSEGSACMLMKKQPDFGEGVLEWRCIMHTCADHAHAYVYAYSWYKHLDG